MNTKICYLYRDASNYKRYNECVVRGEMTPEHLMRIEACLFEGEYFVPRCVGLPERRIEEFRTDDDHCWFEWSISEDYDLNESGVQLTDEPPTDMTVEELVHNFETVREWDETSWMADYPYKSFGEV